MIITFVRHSKGMSENTSNYLERSAGHKYLHDIVKQKQYFPNYPIEELYQRYLTAVLVGAELELLKAEKIIYHSLPINQEQSIDHVVVTGKKIYLISTYTKKMKKIHVFDKYISAEELLDKSYVDTFIEKKVELVTKLNIEEKKLVTVLLVDSLELSTSANVKVDMVTNLDNLLLEISRKEADTKGDIDREGIVSIIESKDAFRLEEITDIASSDLLTKVNSYREKPFGESGVSESKATYKKRRKLPSKKLAFTTLALFLLVTTFQNNEALIKSKYNDLSGSNIMGTNLTIGGLVTQNSKTPTYELLKDSELCPDITNCKVGERVEGGDIIIYDAGTMENWGRYLVMTDHEYTLNGIRQSEFCEIKGEESYQEYLEEYNGGDEIMHRVNNNMFLLSKCSNVGKLLQSTEVENINANQYLIPTVVEAYKLKRYLTLLQEPGYLDAGKNSIFTSSMDEDGLKVLKSTFSKDTVTVILVRVVHE